MIITKLRKKIGQYGGIKQIIKKYGILELAGRTVDFIILWYISIFRNWLYRWVKDDYGLKEAIFFPKGIDEYLRYSKILNELKQIKSNNNGYISILEVGAGGEGVARYLKYSGDFEKLSIVLTDIDSNALENIKLGEPVIADGCNLPFKDNSFDIVVSVDVLEHIPKEMREKFLKELKRVCRKMILLHFVLHDPDNGFLGRDADLKFQKWHVKTFRRPEPNTAEHLNATHPNLEEIRKIFKNAQIMGTQNVDVWFKYMTYSAKPVIGLLTGIFYYLIWRKNDRLPPFHACFLKWTKEVD